MKSRSTRKTRFPRHTGRTGRRTKEMIAIAKQRIHILLTRAEHESISKHNPDRATRYVELARKIAMRYNIRINKYFRNKLCRSCNSFLGGTDFCRVRCRGKRIIIQCSNCGRITRIPIRQFRQGQEWVGRHRCWRFSVSIFISTNILNNPQPILYPESGDRFKGGVKGWTNSMIG